MKAQRVEVWAGLAALLAWIAALGLFPREGERPLTALHVLVLDTSGSRARTTADLAKIYRARLQGAAQEAREAGADFAVVRLASQLEVWRPPGPAPAPDWVGEPAWWTGRFSDGAEGTAWPALGVWLLDAFAQGRPGRVQLESDGAGHGSLDFAFLRDLSDRGIPCLAGQPIRLTHPDGALLDVQLPSQVPAASPYRMVAELGWRGPRPTQPVEVEVRVEGHSSALGGEPAGWQTVGTWKGPDSAAGSDRSGSGPAWLRETLSFDLPGLPAGWYRWEARLRVSGDRVPENQIWRGHLTVGEALRVLVAGDPGPLGPALAEGTPAIAWQRVEDSDWVTAIAEADGIATFGLAPAQLPGAVLQDYLQQGGAWYFQAEWEGLSGWGSLPSPGAVDLGAWLPLEVHHGDREPRDVCLLVDGSGSMEGEGWEQVQSASAALLAGLPPQDGLRLHLFTQDLLPAALAFAPLDGDASPDQLERAKRDRKRAGRALLRTRVPGGPTDILRSLQSFLDRRESERPALAILITDGHESGVVPRDAALVRAACVQANVDLRVIATGENPDQAFLQGLLLPGETLSWAEPWERLASLLQEEVLGEALRQGEDMPVQEAAGAHSPMAPVPSLMAPATVDRYLRTRIRPAARELWVGVEGEPLLAQVRRGLGWVAAAPIRSGGRFAAQQVSGLRTAIAQGAAWGRSQRQPGARLARAQDGVHLYDAPEGDWALWAWTESPEEGGNPTENAQRLDCAPLGPRFGLHPLRNLAVLDPPPVVHAAELRRPDGTRIQRLAWPFAIHPEWRPSPSRWPLDGGRELRAAAPPRPQGRGPHPLGPYLLGLALGSLLICIGILGSRGKV